MMFNWNEHSQKELWDSLERVLAMLGGEEVMNVVDKTTAF